MLAAKHDVASWRYDAERFRREMAERRLAFRCEMAVLRAELREAMTSSRLELSNEIRAAASSLVCQFYVLTIGQTALVLGFAYFLAAAPR